MDPVQAQPYVIGKPRILIRIVLATIALAAGLSHATDPSVPPHLIVLQYHHVSTSAPASTSIAPAQFAAHIDWLAANGFTVVSLPEALQQLRAGTALQDKSVAITFDDGYLDIYTAAFPILRERQLPFTVFVNSAPHDASQAGWASWDQLREMAESGATIANHTTSHLFMIRRIEDETAQEWQQRLGGEIEWAEQRILDETGQSHKILAYPYGESDPAIRALAEELGYSAFGQQSGAVGKTSDFANLPRFPLSGPYSALESFKTKMLSLPLAVSDANPSSRSGNNLLFNDEARPMLTLRLATEGTRALDCFASGQGAIPVDRDEDGSYRIQAAKPLPVGRSRYNCTRASRWPGRYYWYSYAWIRRDTDGNWSHE